MIKFLLKCFFTTFLQCSYPLKELLEKVCKQRFHLSAFTLSVEDSEKLTKQLGEDFKRPVYWNKYKVVLDKQVTVNANAEKPIR